jgi:hypothetical protein
MHKVAERRTHTWRMRSASTSIIAGTSSATLRSIATPLLLVFAHPASTSRTLVSAAVIFRRPSRSASTSSMSFVIPIITSMPCASCAVARDSACVSDLARAYRVDLDCHGGGVQRPRSELRNRAVHSVEWVAELRATRAECVTRVRSCGTNLLNAAQNLKPTQTQGVCVTRGTQMRAEADPKALTRTRARYLVANIRDACLVALQGRL